MGSAYEEHVKELGLTTPYDVRHYADHAPELTFGVRCVLRWLADRWERATEDSIDWDEVKSPYAKG